MRLYIHEDLYIREETRKRLDAAFARAYNHRIEQRECEGHGTGRMPDFFCDTCGAELLTLTSPCPACGQMPSPPDPATSITPHQPAPPPISALAPLPSASLSAPSSVPLKPGDLLINRFRILEKIGAGGFSEVYKAQDLKKGSVVAIKQITLASLSSREIIDATDTYNREITILRSLDHKSLPRLLNHFTDPGHWYIVLEYIDGQTLEEKLASTSDGHLSLDKVLAIGISLCDVLNYLHTLENPVIFRDVKPANIMLTKRGKIYLIDFGIARHYRAEQKKDTGPLGSPGYAAPEQYGKAQSGPRTDIYGLGATLQTLFTGNEPGESQPDSTQPASLALFAFQGLIARMMNPDPEQRPADMLAVKKELKSVQEKSIDVGFSLAILWFFFICLVSSLPFFFGSSGLALFGDELIVVTVIFAFLLIKRRFSGKLSKGDLPLIFYKSLLYTFALNIWGCINTLFFSCSTVIQGLNIYALIKFLVCAVLVVGGWIVIWRMKHFPSFKLPRKKQNPPQDQQIMQPMVIKQRPRK